jgi:hypothetical protein
MDVEGSGRGLFWLISTGSEKEEPRKPRRSSKWSTSEPRLGTWTPRIRNNANIFGHTPWFLAKIY